MHVRQRNSPLARARAGAAAAGALLAVALAGAAPARAAVALPTASTGAASNISYSAAILHGRLDGHGQATDYFFQYGHSSKYGLMSPLSPAGSTAGTLSVSQTISGLAPLTVYHYRLVAVNGGGAAPGSDHSFTTPPVPLSVAIVGNPDPVPFGNPFVVEGTLAGTGSGNHEVRLEADPFPYVSGFTPVGNPELTSATGGFSFPFLGLMLNAQLRVSTVGKPIVFSPVIVEGVAVRVSVRVHATHRRGWARIYGTVTPAEVGARVGFQLLEPGHRSVNVGGTIVVYASATASRFSRVLRVRHGLYKALVQVSDGAHVSAYSPPLLVG